VPEPALTTTSYALLSLLALREWSAYDLIQRMDRSLRFYWPRAQSKLYEEPKKLVAAGLATSRTEPNGRRTRTVYRITPAGRRALRRWLADPGGPPVLEFEAMLKIAFADQTGLDGLRANIEAVLEEAQSTRAFGHMLAGEFLAGAPTFAERLHIGVLVWHFFTGWAEQRETWARFALDWIDGWEDTKATPEKLQAARAYLDQAIKDGAASPARRSPRSG
jgi:DNA-binding PadR family transcriptional regulator